MQYAQPVRVRQRIGDLHSDVTYLERMQRRGAQPVGVRAVAQFHDQKWVPVAGVPGVEQVHHVRMAGHPAGRPGLAHEPAPIVLAVQAPVLDLYGDVPAHRLLYRPVHRRVPAPRQHAQAGQPGYDRRRDGGYGFIHE